MKDKKQVAGYITRKSMLYKTGVEYSDYTMNHVLGCAHGCLYPCYAYLMKKRFGQVKSYEDWINPYLVSNTLELLDKEIPKLQRKIKSVHLCFSTDPFMYGYKEIADMSIAAIKKLNTAGIKCTVLTKGILPAELAELSTENEYGITLVTLDGIYRRKTEPYASPISARLQALKYLHTKGCKTWVSMEPYPTPNIKKQSTDNLLSVMKFTDKIIFSRTNYNKQVTAYKEHKQFYNAAATDVIRFCKDNNIACHIKEKTITAEAAHEKEKQRA